MIRNVVISYFILTLIVQGGLIVPKLFQTTISSGNESAKSRVGVNEGRLLGKEKSQNQKPSPCSYPWLIV